MQNQTDPAGLALVAKFSAKLLAAQAAAERPKLDGRNTHQGYGYSSNNEIARVARLALTTAGIVVREIAIETTPPTDTAPEGTLSIVRVATDTETGYSETMTQTFPIGRVGGRHDPDKNQGGALSLARKFWALGYLMLDRGDPREDGDATPRQPPAKPKPKPAPEPARPPLTDAEFAEVLVNAPAAPVVKKEGAAYLKRFFSRIDEAGQETLRALLRSYANVADGKAPAEGMPPHHIAALDRARTAMRTVIDDDGPEPEPAPAVAPVTPAARVEALADMADAWQVMCEALSMEPTELPPLDALRSATGRKNATAANLTIDEARACEAAFDARAKGEVAA